MIDKIKSNKYIPYFIIVLASIILLFTFFRMNLSNFNEARIHIIRIVSIKEVLSKGIFPSLISSKHMMGFGYGLNIFYGPLTTFIPIILSVFFGTSIMGLKVFTLLTFILSGITMYQLIYKISKRKLIALLSALIYISAPYKLTDIYSRNAVGEYLAFIFIPLVFNGLYELIHGNKKKHYLLIIGGAGLILSHTITTIYVAVFAIIYLIINYKKLREIIKYLIIDILIIILLTSFYLLPLLEHKIYGDYTIFNAESMGATGKAVQASGLNFLELFKSEFGSQEIVFSIGIIMLFGLILTPFTFKKSKQNKEYTLYLIFGLISLWMCTRIFPWFILPNFLTIVQFAWRLEGFFIFFLSYICACNIISLSEMLKDKNNIIAYLITISIILCGFFGTYRYKENGDLNKDVLYENNLIKSEILGPYQVNREYLPEKAKPSYIEYREDRSYILNGIATISNEEKTELNYKCNIETSENTIIELPYIYYHGYTVKLNNKKLNTFESDNGFLAVELSESGNLTVEFTGTNLQKIGYVLSTLTLIGVITYYTIKRRKN